MANLTIVANIKANADKVELVKAELLKLIDITRAKEGCINYDLHLKEHMIATEGAVEEFTLSEMTRIA